MKKRDVDHVLRAAGLIVGEKQSMTELLNLIGADSPFHEEFGFYADPVDESTAILPEGWRGRLVNLPPGDTEGVRGLCLDPHDLAIAKYSARREKDRAFTRELARRGLVDKQRLLSLVKKTPVAADVKGRMRDDIEQDFEVKS